MPDDTPPTREEIAQLPRWAQVAFAARCARLAQPFFLRVWPDAPEKYVMAIENSLRVAETAAASADDTYTDWLASYVHTSDADADIYAAAYAADYAAATVYVATRDTVAAAAAADAAKAGVNVSHLRFDFDTLLKRSRSEKWTDTTPVPPTVFPPIASDPSVPTPAAANTVDPVGDSELVIKAYIRDGVDPQVARQRLRALYNSLNDYSIARFGKGLTIKDFQQYILTGVPAEVLS